MIIKQVLISCDADNCDNNTADGNSYHDTIRKAIVSAQENGWLVRQGKTICPDCRWKYKLKSKAVLRQKEEK